MGARSVSNNGPTRRDAPARVEQDAERLALDGRVDVARGERRTIGERGAGADDDRLRLRRGTTVRVGARASGPVIHCDEPSAAAM